MLLPDKNMNIERYPVSEDRIDVTLYECFEGGALAKYFEKGDEGLREWVKREHLELLFNRRVIKRENIKWFQGDDQHHKRISEMNSTELYEYLDRATIFIQYRTRALEQAGLWEKRVKEGGGAILFLFTAKEVTKWSTTESK